MEKVIEIIVVATCLSALILIWLVMLNIVAGGLTC